MNWTTDNLTSFTEGLKRALGNGLPGKEAHLLMDPLPPKRREWGHMGKEPRKSAVMILLYEQSGQIKFPLIQRPVYEGAHSGQVALPGGKYEELDENLINTALRETNEEIGSDVGSVEILGQLSGIYVPPSNFDIQPVVGVLHNEVKFVPEPREVLEIFSVSVTDLLNPNLRKQKTITVSKKRTDEGALF